jgi:hypothetical protein
MSCVTEGQAPVHRWLAGRAPARQLRDAPDKPAIDLGWNFRITRSCAVCVGRGITGIGRVRSLIYMCVLS